LPATICTELLGTTLNKQLVNETMMASAHRYTHPEAKPGFWAPELGRRFREAAYKRHRINRTESAPQTITVLSNAAAEQVGTQH